MSIAKESFRDIISEFNQEEVLERDQIVEYSKRFSEAWRREKIRVNVKAFRAKKSESVITPVITPAITSTKEERITKENLPPTPPIREKNKKEENASPIGSAAARASVLSRVREANVIPTWEMVLTRAKTTIGCNNIAWLREWFNEMNCANWCDGDGNPIHNWGRALGIAWRYKDVDAARRDPSRFQKPVDKELEEAERRKEQQKKLIQEQIAIVKAKYLAEQEAMNECR